MLQFTIPGGCSAFTILSDWKEKWKSLESCKVDGEEIELSWVEGHW